MRQKAHRSPGPAAVRVAEFSLVTVYEDFAACVRASEMVKRLAGELSPEFGIRGSAWKFESLRHARHRNRAAAKACAAYMIIISSSASAELPSHVLGWIESWLPHRRTGPAALVALLELEEVLTSAQSPPLYAALRRMAEEANLDFFCNVGDGLAGDFNDRAQYLNQRAEVGSARPGGAFYSPAAFDAGASLNKTGRTATKRPQDN